MRGDLARIWLALGAAAALAGAAVLPSVHLPADSPVTLLSTDPSGSVESAKGGASVVDLHLALTLRNSGGLRIRGITMVVQAQDVTAGGKASVTVPSLDVAPGEAFPVHIELRLLRPVQVSNALIEVGLDGVLFDDLGFYGPNRLNSRRALTVYELEARRDRKYYRALLDSGGPQKLQQEVLAAMVRHAAQPGMQVQMARGRPTNVDVDRQVQFAFVHFPDAPVDSPGGSAHVRGNEAVPPGLEVRNRSGQAIRSVEIGWILRDQQGREFLAGSVPADLNLAPGEKRQMASDAVLRFSPRTGQPAMTITGMTGFVNNVEFADGRVWIPSRATLENPRVASALNMTPEEDRLLQIYRRKGLKALVEELKKF